jgi:hypothetical protein
MYKNLYKALSKNEKIEKQEKIYSQEEVIEIIKDCLIKKSLKNSHIDIDLLEKSWRKAFANGLTVLGLVHGAHYIGSDSGQLSERQKSPTYQRIHQEMEAKKQRKPSSVEEGISSQPEQNKNSKIDSFLKTISMNESSGGKNLNHKKMKSGIHKDDSAIGQYGLMPNTIKEMAGRMGPKHPLSSYSKMDSKKIVEKIKNNPQHEKEIATFMANHLHDKFGGDENKMSYSWNQGHNMDVNHKKFTSGEYKNHGYVKKYNKHKQSFQNKNPVTKTPDIE